MPYLPHNHKEKKIPELLAPAGSPESFRAAVAGGADAIYLSGKKFGARRSAANFSEGEIKKAVSYAHSRDIRVYVTINTLIHDRELPDVAEYLIWLYSIGVDAVLVQDTGIAALARDIVPLLPLHASTQMTIHSTEGVRWAAEQGFSRVVLARELTLDGIGRIARETGDSGIGLEVFVHGALCYSYSGQCLLSSVIGGRSGNRGMCAQPCRKPYTMMTGDTDEYGRPTDLCELPSTGRYLLSPKDLCTFKTLPSLVSSPVVSLKIEGRMKSPEYVAIVVSTYRRALDAIAAGKAYKSFGAYQDLHLAFNRGYTSGYLFEKSPAAIMGTDASDNRGICIGYVRRYDEKSKTISFRSDRSPVPSPGDGILLTHPKNPGKEYGFSLNTIPVQKDGEMIIRVPHPVEPGTGVFITSSSDLEQRARQIIAHPPAGLRHPVPVDLDIRVKKGGNLVVEGLIHTRSGGVIPLIYRPDLCLVPARSHPVTRDQVEQQLKKTGGTPFAIRNFSLEYSGDLFAPLAGLNRVRREFLARAEEMLIAHSHPPQNCIEQARQRWNDLKPEVIIPPPETSGTVSTSSLILGVCTDSLLSVEMAAEAGCDCICFEPVLTPSESSCRLSPRFTSFASQTITASRICREAGSRFVLKFPRITDNSYLDLVLPFLSQALNPDNTEVMVENWGTVHALMHHLPASVLFGSTGLNIFNHEAVRHLPSCFGSVTLSPELSHDEIRLLIHGVRQGIRTPSFALIVQGSVEAMVSENCLLQSRLSCNRKAGDRKAGDSGTSRFCGIMDATGHTFPVRIDSECRTHIFNSAEICLIDHLPSLRQMGITTVLIDARGRTGTYTRDMIHLYQEAIQLAKKDVPANDPHFRNLKDAAKRIALGGITAGHFIRGLQES